MSKNVYLLTHSNVSIQSYIYPFLTCCIGAYSITPSAGLNQFVAVSIKHIWAKYYTAGRVCTETELRFLQLLLIHDV